MGETGVMGKSPETQQQMRNKPQDLETLGESSSKWPSSNLDG